MFKNVSAVGFGAVLSVVTILLAVGSLLSVTKLNNAIVHAALKAPDSPAYDFLLMNRNDLITPLLFCMAPPVAAFLIGSIMAFRGELSISYRTTK